MIGNLNQARLLIEGLGVKENEETLEMALNSIERFGNYKNALLESSKDEYKYDKAMIKLIKLSDYKPQTDENALLAEEILSLMHLIHKSIIEVAHEHSLTEAEAIKKVDIQKSFNLTALQRCVLNKIGGREAILNVNFSEPNSMIRKIINAIELCNKSDNFVSNNVLTHDSKDMLLN